MSATTPSDVAAPLANESAEDNNADLQSAFALLMQQFGRLLGEMERRHEWTERRAKRRPSAGSTLADSIGRLDTPHRGLIGGDY